MNRVRSIWSCLVFRQAATTNVVFRLQYKLTFILLLALSIIVACRHHYTEPIRCLSRDALAYGFLNSHCYSDSTFTIEEAWNKTVGEDIPYPGISKYSPGETKIYHTYYQWISLVLFLQALLFLVPRWFWKVTESGRIEDMVSDLNSPSIAVVKDNVKLLADDITSNLKFNKGYFALNCVAEMLSLVNVIGQMFWMNSFLNGGFFAYGLHLTRRSVPDDEVPYYGMLRYFPRVTKCTYRTYGASGIVQRNDAMCNLPINVLNEKIYAFLWFWFVALAILGFCLVAYRLLILISPRLRACTLRLRTRRDGRILVRTVLEKGDVGDWFVLCLLSKNMKPRNFKDLLSLLAEDRDNESIKLHM